MSAVSVSAYLSPTILRNFAISSDESCGARGWTIFIVVVSRSFPSHGRASQPVVDGLAQSVRGDRHHGDQPRGACVESAKIAEKVGGGFIEIAACGQIHGRGSLLRAGKRGLSEPQTCF